MGCQKGKITGIKNKNNGSRKKRIPEENGGLGKGRERELRKEIDISEKNRER